MEMRRTRWKAWVGPLASRKVRVALATVAAAFGAQWGLEVSEEMVFTILGVGTSVILGIAHEDAGRWSAAGDKTHDEG